MTKVITKSNLHLKLKSVKISRWSLLLVFLFLGSVLNAQIDGSTCEASIGVDEIPYSHSGNTATFGNNYNSSDVPTDAPDAVTNGSGDASYLNGDDVIYSYTAGADGSISISTTNDDNWVGLWVFTGCPFDSTVGYHVATGGATRSVTNLPVEEGETYYIVISTWPSPQSTDYTLSIEGTDIADPPTCPKPKHLTLDSSSVEEAEISWTAGDEEEEWEVIFGEAGFDVENEGETFSIYNDPSIQLTELTPNTSYDVYVLAICEENDISTLTGPLNFFTSCTASDIPFTQNFEDVDIPELPNCGSSETISGNTWKTKNVLDFGFDSNVLNYTYNTSEIANSWYFTQGINLEEGSTYQITYKYGNRGSFAEKLKVAMGTSPMSSSMDTELIDHTNILEVDIEEINFTVPADGVYYFGFQAHSDANQNQLYVDDIFIDLAPTCLKPTDLAVDNITTDSADLSWTAGENETEWEVVYGEAGFDIDTEGESVEVVDNPNTSLTDLTQNTVYDFYVKAICSEDDESYFAGPITFATNCGTASIPYMLDFENAAVPNIPSCTTQENNGIGNDWKTRTAPTGFTGNVLNYSYHSFINPGPANSWFYTQGIELEAGVNYDISYKYGNNTTLYTESMKVAYGASPEEAAMSNELADYPEIEISSPAEELITFSVDTDGVYYFGFNVYSIENQNQLYVDDIQIVESPSCPKPTDLTISNATEDSAEVTWTESTDATQWEVIYGETGFEVDTEGESTTVNDDPSVTITDLSAGTSYDVYVKAICDTDEESELTDAVSFTTMLEDGYCLPEGTNSARYINNFSTTGGVDNISNMDSGFSPAGYGNFMDMIVSKENTEEVSFEADIQGGSAGFRIWVDWNQDGEFTEDEVIYQSNNYSSSHSGSFSVPIDADAGQTRMRVVSNWSSSTGAVDPCATNFSGGEFEDYTFEVIPLDTCSDATAGTIISGDISVCDNTSFTLEVEGDSEPAEGITRQWMSSTDGDNWEEIEGATNSSYTVSEGIEEETQYKYVITCSEDDSTDETEVITVSLNPANECYCEPSFPSNVEPITYVSFADIDNTSDATLNGSPALEDFTDQTAFVNQGEEYPIEIQGNTNGFYTSRIVVYIDWNQDGVFDDAVGSDEMYTLPDIYNSTGEDGVSSEGMIEVPESALAGNTRMRVMKRFSTLPGPCNTLGYGQAEDYTINVSQGEPGEECAAPEGLAVDDITENSAFVIWEPGMDPEETEGWEVVYGIGGFDIDGDNGMTIIVDDAPFTVLESLEAETEYDVYIRTICGENEHSDWTGPESFTTAGQSVYCSPFTDANNSAPDRAQPDRNTNFTTTGAVDNFEDETIFEYGPGAATTVDDAAPNGYADLYDTYTVKQYSGESFDFSVDYKGNGVHYYIWIDFNQDSQFQDVEYSDTNTDGERFFMQNIPSPSDPTITGTINIPENIEAGEYRMRIRGINDISNISDLPCDEIAWGEARDYKLEVLEGQPSLCQSPLLVEVNNVTETTAQVSWTADADEEEWEVLYGVTGFDTNSEGESVLVEETSYTMEDLEADTEYDVYVRSICGEEEFSDWTGPETFTTEEEPLEECQAPTDVEVTNITDTSADVSWTASGNETQWEVLYGETGFDIDSEGENAIVEVVTLYNIAELDPETEYDVYVRAVCDEDNFSDWVGPVTFTTDEEVVEECEAPTDVEVTDITQTTAEVTWTPQGAEQSWAVIYGESGFDQGDEDDYQTDIVLAPSHTLDELTPETDYDVYVYAICDEEEMIYSDQVGPITFMTDEMSVDSQEFNNFTFYPNPVENQLSLKAGVQIENVQVFNLLGQNVISAQPNSLEAQINTEALQSGVYLMKVSINGNQKTFRVVKK